MVFPPHAARAYDARTGHLAQPVHVSTMSGIETRAARVIRVVYQSIYSRPRAFPRAVLHSVIHI